MRVAIVDVGSNTARLLVADVEGNSLARVDVQRSYLRLGAEIERRGSIGPAKLVEAADVVAGFGKRAAALRAERVCVIVTAPGRQAVSGQALVEALERAARSPARVLTAAEEGRLAFEGAVALARRLPESVGVVDVGGGSTEIAVGAPVTGPSWIRSVDVGSLRLTRQLLDGTPPGGRAVTKARASLARAFAGVDPPQPDAALAVGGSARAIAKVVGQTLATDALEELVRVLTRRPAARALRRFGIAPTRAETVLGGALILIEACTRLGRPLELAAGGLREGAALALARNHVEAVEAEAA